jgi:hypothetical protein
MEMTKYYLELFVNLQVVPGVMQTSLSLRLPKKSISEGDLNAKHQFWDS